MGDGERLEKVAEGKTKVVFSLCGDAGTVLIRSKDRITAGDGSRAHDLAGKARISNETNRLVFEYLTSLGMETHFIRQHSEDSFVSRHCDMVPLEWVTRRIATGSFIRRYPEVPEGFRFVPVKQEIFFKDDQKHDPLWIEEQVLAAKLVVGKQVIGKKQIRHMSYLSRVIFEVLEKAWLHLDCALVDMKVEFGVDRESGTILLADVIDNDSWRIWPYGDKTQMKDKQVYRNLREVTAADLEKVKLNFEWINDRLAHIKARDPGKVKGDIFAGQRSQSALRQDRHCDGVRQGHQGGRRDHEASPQTGHLLR